MEYAAYILATLLQRNAICLANGEIWFGQVSPEELVLIGEFRDAMGDVVLMVQSEEEHYLVGVTVQGQQCEATLREESGPYLRDVLPGMQRWVAATAHGRGCPDLHVEMSRDGRYVHNRRS